MRMPSWNSSRALGRVGAGLDAAHVAVVGPVDGDELQLPLVEDRAS